MERRQFVGHPVCSFYHQFIFYLSSAYFQSLISSKNFSSLISNFHMHPSISKLFLTQICGGLPLLNSIVFWNSVPSETGQTSP